MCPSLGSMQERGPLRSEERAGPPTTAARQRLWVGRGRRSGVTLLPLSLSLQPFTYPVCTPEGVVFDLL